MLLVLVQARQRMHGDSSRKLSIMHDLASLVYPYTCFQQLVAKVILYHDRAKPFTSNRDACCLCSYRRVRA